MKNSLIILALFFISISFAQDKVVHEKSSIEKIEFTNVAIEITVDSAKDIEETFTVTDIKEMLDDTNPGEDISFKIICNGEKMSNGKKSHMSYAIEGNTDNKEEFLKSINKIRQSAINYYNNKN
ncbi:hypothetical protein [Winogradskyella sp. A3E31]|uniref:hypothetical protein n=1 Tax=Winogradskyella sp. A3E31 TaxID=3349637 RepID=UPI00398A80A3